MKIYIDTEQNYVEVEYAISLTKKEVDEGIRLFNKGVSESAERDLLKHHIKQVNKKVPLNK